MDEKKRVIIVEPDAEIGHLLRGILADEGYEVALVRDPKPAIEEARATRPDAIIVDVRGVARGLQLLDELRIDHEASQVPVLALARSKELTMQALASYNVRKVISRPFHADDLVDKLREVLGEQPLHREIPPEATHDGVIGLAEYLLARYARSIMARWIMRVREEAPWQDRSDLDERDVMDVTPVVVEAIVAALHYRDPMRYFKDHPEAVARLSKHGEIRSSQAIPLTALLREFSLLRDEVWAALWAHLPRSIATADVINLQRVVNPTVDYILEESTAAYTRERFEPPMDRASSLDEMAETSGDPVDGRPSQAA